MKKYIEPRVKGFINQPIMEVKIICGKSRKDILRHTNKKKHCYDCAKRLAQDARNKLKREARKRGNKN